MRRRDFLWGTVAAGLAAQLPAPAQKVARKGRIKQGAMRVNFDPKLSFDQMCKIAADAGIHGFDNIAKEEWPILKKYGLIPTMSPTGGVTFEDGLIRPATHDALVKSMSEQIAANAAAGCPGIITIGGQRRGMSNEEGWENASKLLKRVLPRAEDKGINICIEIMNTRYTPPELGRVDQICNHIGWGVELCKRVNSPRMKMVCDIYHLQIMDGNVVENIRTNFPYIAHFHTGGVPGRHEIDETQELNYRYIAYAIADLGFTGYVTHEYHLTPGKDSAHELNRAIEIIDV